LDRPADLHVLAGLTADLHHPPAAAAALRQKKAYENELDRIAGTRMTLETQVNAIESANMNLETMTAMRKGADALRNIHGSLYVAGCASSCGVVADASLLLPATSTRSTRRWTRFASRWTSQTRSAMRSRTRWAWATISTR
jgi:hypothetical protein